MKLAHRDAFKVGFMTQNDPKVWSMDCDENELSYYLCDENTIFCKKRGSRLFRLRWKNRSQFYKEGDVIGISLNCVKWPWTFEMEKNEEVLEMSSNFIERKKVYYPSVGICGCYGTVIQVLDE